MSKVMNKVSDGFWDWLTSKGALNAFEYKLRILAYILYSPVILYCVVMGGITLTKYHYPWTLNLEWLGTCIIFIIIMVGFIGCLKNYSEFKRRK